MRVEYFWSVSATKTVLETVREVVQDLLVPELQAMKLSIDMLRVDMKSGDETTRTEMKMIMDDTRKDKVSSGKHWNEAFAKAVSGVHKRSGRLLKSWTIL